MRYTPLNYNQINIAAGTYQPNTVKAYNNQAFRFWERALYQRAISIIDFDGLPFDGAVEDFFKWCLYSYGFVAFLDTDKYGLIFQPCTLSGEFDIYYQPIKAIISNPKLQKICEIGKDCALLKLTPDYMGICDVVSYYAEKLATADNAINTSLINSKLAYIIGAKNKASARALKSLLDGINAGNPAVIYDKELLIPNDPDDKKEPWQQWSRNVKESYITKDLLQDFQTILNNFDAEIGIPTIPYAKKERMVTSEAESRVLDSTSRSTVWINTLKSSLKEVNSMYGLNISAELHYKEDDTEEVNEDGKTDIV